jgi:tRNA1(Val) A37 N6-methylase TrmN6
MEKINYLLGYPDMYIYQDSEWFNFSLDSILLPNFVNIKKNTSNILDIGSGNAVIPMILSTKTDKNIIGVELQQEVYDLGMKSILKNKLENRIQFYNMDIKQFAKEKDSDTFDIITCNPPYFPITDNPHLNENIHKQLARHEVTLNLDDIMQISRKLLKNGSSLYLVHRPDRFIEIIEKMKNYNLEPKRVKFVYPKLGKNANILLIEGVKDGKKGLKIEEPLYIYNEDGQYTEEVKQYFS